LTAEEKDLTAGTIGPSGRATFLRDACGDEASMRTIAAEPSGAGLSPQDRAVYEFAAKVA
jgi:hypothetical protein